MPGNVLTEPLRRRIAAAVTRLTHDSRTRIDYSQPPGDPGLFGPDAVCWRVHADFASMLTGGITALLMQALHPLAMAGVWDHSRFREDLAGRLAGTATFVAGTTFAARADALALIDTVKRIHQRVVGVAPDGRPYAADDPALLCWVHVAETSSFLAAYLRYVDPTLSPADQDRYYAETATLAERLGATDVPRSVAAVRAYLDAMRPHLLADARAAEVVRVVMSAPPPSRLAWPVSRLILNAGVDLLPAWGQTMLGLSRGARLRAAVVRPGVRAIGRIMRWALIQGISRRARARVAGGAKPADDPARPASPA
ncbi:oxygenase MpaB family protein [Chitinasiproducens palmae]|uniref:Uncharacterized conserved protein, DUF2236 family n=1 Tax=Chitinasiproducens palmae TaxID=1770053 RepID=A0A1H2PNA9_9BURK|nr:oxygenase MpaB family protein [Chitinasiproducens palmae]SDV48130.1 Uncharacterized conserved protein, DUF2236 family [Chitinasiproducens palmae]